MQVRIGIRNGDFQRLRVTHLYCKNVSTYDVEYPVEIDNNKILRLLHESQFEWRNLSNSIEISRTTEIDL